MHLKAKIGYLIIEILHIILKRLTFIIIFLMSLINCLQHSFLKLSRPLASLTPLIMAAKQAAKGH